VIGEIVGWVGHAPQALKEMRDNLAYLDSIGVEAIED
jgi:rifampin ADP-ribosylating transferase